MNLQPITPHSGIPEAQMEAPDVPSAMPPPTAAVVVNALPERPVEDGLLAQAPTWPSADLDRPPVLHAGDAQAPDGAGTTSSAAKQPGKSPEDMAQRWLQAALKHDASARKELASLYAKPCHGEPDGAGMLAWFKAAAFRGDSDAQFVLGRCCMLGTFGIENAEAGWNWYTKAADGGHAAAQYHLGGQFEDGEVCTQDYEMAAKYYRLSAAQGYGDAACQLNGLYGTGVCHKPSGEPLQRWLQKAAENGHVLSQAHLGRMYYEGNHVEQDYAEAKAWYSQAMEQGDTSAMFNMGILYMHGLGGLERDPEAALRHFLRAASLDCERLGMCDLNGLDMTDEVAQLLNHAMQQLDTVDTLDLSKNQIGDSGAIAIAGLIESAKCPRVIDLRMNAIDARGAFALEAATRRTTALQELKIDTAWNPPSSNRYAERIRIACTVNRNIALLHQWWVDRTHQATFARLPSDVVQSIESQVVLIHQKRNGDGTLLGTWNRLLEIDLCMSTL